MSADEDTPEVYFPQGPALLYVHSDEGTVLDGTRTITQVDRGLPLPGGPVSGKDVRRERRILRALLEQALWLLDQEEGRA